MNVLIVGSETAAHVIQSLCGPSVEVCYPGMQVDSKRIRRLYIIMASTPSSLIDIHQVTCSLADRMTEDGEIRAILI